MPESIHSVDVVQMSMVLYALKKAQNVEGDASKMLIDKTLKKIEENNREIEKELYPWLGQSIDKMV
jgi:hypothetical protein